VSLKPSNTQQIPEATVKVARAAFPKGDNVYMKIRDECGGVYQDEQFADLFGVRGKPAEAPGRLALVIIMQFAEGMTDREAADAVRSRIDWKYALGLPLEDPGFHYSVLSKFRSRLLGGSAEERLLDLMLVALQEQGVLKAGGKQRTDSTHVLAAIRTLNRLEFVGETLRQALNSLAVVVPDWLRSWVPVEWFERYSVPVSSYRLPKEREEREQLALLMGLDGIRLLSAIDSVAENTCLRFAPAMKVLRQVWFQQYCFDENGALAWRTNKETPPAADRVISPYDVEARQGKKRETGWLGYKLHLTETCDLDAPKLITNVETRIASQQDGQATEDIHRSLAEKALLPKQHVVDTAYVTGSHLVTSEEAYGIELLGPVRPDTSWQARQEEAYDVAQFELDWQRKRAICPQGHVSKSWKAGEDRHAKLIINATFSLRNCRHCPARARCTTSNTQGRHLTLRPQAAHEAIQARRKYQETEEFRDAYAVRAGVEGVISQAVYALESRRARYRGLTKTHLQHLATAAAINLRRAANWLLGYETATTQTSQFARLAPS